MSARFWLFSMASAGAALMGGLGLGLYATTPPRTSFSDYQESAAVAQSQDAMFDATHLNGPQEVRCTGCGPTLAQRQMAAMMGGWDGYSDPVVRDYAAQADEPEGLLSETADAPPSPMHQLPANIDRFAIGETTAAQPVQLAQGAGGAEASTASQP